MERSQNAHGKALLQFYFLVIYVFLQFSWWTYLIIDLNREVHDLKVAQLSNYSQSSKLKHDQMLQKRKWMIIGESSVFVAILLLGVYRTWRSLRRETDLALLQRNFLLATAHELRTPVASVRLQLDTVARHQLDQDQTRKLLQHARNETERLELLIEKALLASRLENGQYPLNPEPFSPADFLTQKLQSSFQIPFEEGRLLIRTNDSSHVLMDKTAFASIFINLVENALKYGGEHSKVNIDLNLSDAELCLRVLDHGPGIKEHEKKLIFSRFYRSGNEETRNTRGTGLGLFIVAQLVKAMKGKIKVENNHSQGSVFEVVLPVHPSA